jgi:hypothetical protein
MATATVQLMAQQDEGPILRPKKPAAKPTVATLLVMCDLACNWKLDGGAKGHMDAGGSAKAKVELGEHVLAAVTDDGLDKVEKDIEIKTSGQTIFRVVLQPVRNDRLQAQQDADPVYLRAHAAERARKGQDLYEQHEYKQAKPLLEKACNGGEMAACVTLGSILQWDNDLGTTTYKNLLTARSLYNKACDSGVMRGCTSLGETYELPGDQDYNKSNRLFQKACDGGDTWGCNNLGLSYQFGYGVIRDLPKARALFQKACLDGYAEACDNLRRLQ